MERLERQMRFLLEADKLKTVTRQTWLADGSRKETDAEHSWHLALMAVLLNEYAEQPADVLKVVTMVLIHDVVEIDAGDTFAYDYAGQETAHDREAKAAERLFGLLPADQAQYMKNLWEEFEARETPEARFAHTLDNCQPQMLNDASGGIGWAEHHVRKSDVYRRNARTAEGSAVLWARMKKIVDRNIADGHIIDDSEPPV